MHTPGPWTVRAFDAAGSAVIDAEGRRAVATAVRLNNSTPANARLIAAAPDLLEALKLAQAYLNRQYAETDAVDLDLLNAVNHAVAKAKGGAS